MEKEDSAETGLATMANSAANDRDHKVLEKCVLFSSLDEKARSEIAAYAVVTHFFRGRVDMSAR